MRKNNTRYREYNSTHTEYYFYACSWQNIQYKYILKYEDRMTNRNVEVEHIYKINY